MFTSSLLPYEDLDQEESHIAPMSFQVEDKVEEHAKEEPHLYLRVQEGRHESKMVESIHVGKYGGYELPLVEGPLKAPLVFAEVVSGPMLQG
jgi:hypothetical protein